MLDNNPLIYTMERLAHDLKRPFPKKLPEVEPFAKTSPCCGVKEIDEATGGFRPGYVYAFPFESECLPSPFLKQFVKSGIAAHCFLLDTPLSFAARSLLCEFSQMELGDVLFRRRMTDEKWDSVCRAYSLLFKSRITLHRCKLLSPDMLREIISLCGAGDLIFIDYMDKMQSDTPEFAERKREELSDIAFELHNIAQEFKVPAVFGMELYRPRPVRKSGAPLRLVDFQRNVEDGFCDVVCTVENRGNVRKLELVKNRFGACVTAESVES